MSEEQLQFLERAISLSKEGVEAKKGGPFGCVIVREGKIVGEGYNMVTSTNDPTAHGEVVAIRNACKNLGTFVLDGCDVYTSCEPCPMCFAAIYWSRASKVYYSNTKKDAAKVGFDDDFLYNELEKPYGERKVEFHHVPLPSATDVFENWAKNK